MNAKNERRLVTAPQLGQTFRARRKALGLSQAELATRVGLSQGRLSVLETDAGSLSVERLLALAAALGLEIVVRAPKPSTSRREEW